MHHQISITVTEADLNPWNPLAQNRHPGALAAARELDPGTQLCFVRSRNTLR